MSSSPSGGDRRRHHKSQNRAPSRVGKSSQPVTGKGGKRAASGSQPSRWLMVLLTGCMVLLVAIVITRLVPFRRSPSPRSYIP